MTFTSQVFPSVDMSVVENSRISHQVYVSQERYGAKVSMIGRAVIHS